MTDIAVTGIDCRFPQARDPAVLWSLLMRGADGVSEVPDNRWSVDEFYSAEGGPGRMNTRYGGFLADADAFDHEFFGISPREAEAMDPQQRLLLQTAWRALEDATLDPRAMAGSRTGVFVGVMGNEWAQLHMTDYERVTPQLGSGNGYCMTANRLSYQLDLKGPSLAVDTACSSSLVAVHMACAALRTGDCDQALAGGVNVVLTPALNIFYTQAGLSAPDGRCKPFSAEANGIGRGEGVGVVVLHRLEDAIDAGLPVHAVIKGGAVNHDGRSNGLTAPSRWSQRDVVAEAYRRAGVAPADVSFVEAHGTGTVLGDMIEAKALGDVHAVARTRGCAIGSIKGNLGHTEGAAGIAGLIKVALALRHGVVPPSRYAQGENPRLRLSDHGLRLLKAPMRLAGNTHAGISSFGLGGTNAHLVMASPPSSGPAPMAGSLPRGRRAGRSGGGVLTVSAGNAAGLRAQALQLADELAATPRHQLGQLCWTTNQVKASGRVRLAVVGNDRDRLTAHLRAGVDALGRGKPPGRDERRLSIGWLFTGQGAQYPGMTGALFHGSGAYRRALDDVDETMAPHLGRSIRDLMLSGDPAIHRTEYAQPALFAAGYALGRVLVDLGVTPAWMVGHSVGEYAAATLAGALDLDDAGRLVTARGRLMDRLPRTGGMLAARCGLADAAALVADEPLLDVAAVNGPDNIVISGQFDALDRIEAELTRREVITRRLDVSHAFHSPLVEPVLEEFAAVVAGTTCRRPRIPIYSTLRGRLIDGESMDAGYWTEQIRATVVFADAVRQAEADRPPSHVIEVGPRRLLGPLAGRLRADRSVPALTPCPGPEATGEELLGVLARLYHDGLNPNWDRAYEEDQRVRLRLRPYEFSTTSRFWTRVAIGGDRPRTVVVASREIDAHQPADHEREAPAGSDPLYSAFRAIVAEVCGYSAEEIHAGSRLYDDLGYDSIMAVRLAQRIGNQGGTLPLPQELLSKAVTVGDLVAFARANPSGLEPRLIEVN